MSEIVVKNVMNVEFAKDRSESREEIILSVVSANGFVVAQAGIFESHLPTLTPATFTDAEMKRESIKIGEEMVTYELAFTPPNMIQSNAYALLSIPKNEVRLQEDTFDCEEVRTRNNLECQVIDQSEDFYYVRIGDLCWNQHCEANTRIAWEMKLSNSNILIFEEEARSIELQLFTEDNYPI